MDTWRKCERREVEKMMKHVSVVENVGCCLSLSAIKGE